MEKMYETVATGSVDGINLCAFLELLKFYSSAQLHTVAYLKNETEYTHMRNRTSIFVNTYQSQELDTVRASVLLDEEKVYIDTLRKKSPETTIIDGTKFKSGSNMVRAITSSNVNGDIEKFLKKLGCRSSSSVCQFGIRVQLINGAEVAVYKDKEESVGQSDRSSFSVDIICTSSESHVQDSSDRINATITILNNFFMPKE